MGSTVVVVFRNLLICGSSFYPFLCRQISTIDLWVNCLLSAFRIESLLNLNPIGFGHGWILFQFLRVWNIWKLVDPFIQIRCGCNYGWWELDQLLIGCGGGCLACPSCCIERANKSFWNRSKLLFVINDRLFKHPNFTIYIPLISHPLLGFWNFIQQALEWTGSFMLLSW